MSSTLTYFNGKYYKYHSSNKKEQGLAIGGYESVFLSDLVTSYIFEKSKTLLNRTTYHGIYQYDGLVVFKRNRSVKEIKDWLEKFQQTVNIAAGNQHLQFTV